jgi:hypothetical protein
MYGEPGERRPESNWIAAKEITVLKISMTHKRYSCGMNYFVTQKWIKMNSLSGILIPPIAKLERV